MGLRLIPPYNMRYCVTTTDAYIALGMTIGCLLLWFYSSSRIRKRNIPAILIKKHQDTHPQLVYQLFFSIPGGKELNFMVEKKKFDKVTEGQEGELIFRGEKLISFPGKEKKPPKRQQKDQEEYTNQFL